MRSSKQLISIFIATSFLTHCGSKKSDKAKDDETVDENGDGAEEEDDENKTAEDESTYSGNAPAANQVIISGTLALRTLHLTGETVTHVVAINTETGASSHAEVAKDGSFELNIDQEKPWLINYIDETKTGADMMIATFSADTLDTLSVSADVEKIALGTVDATEAKATADLGQDQLLESIGMSAEAAETMGSVDDISLRYSNPDIDSNSKIDAIEGKTYLIDFHNRFTAKDTNGNQLSITDMKNQFYPDTTVVSYTGTGIFPQIPRSDFAKEAAPATYEWTFSVDMPTASNGGAVCEGMSAGDTISAGTACSLEYTNNVGGGDKSFTFNLETANLAASDYTLTAGEKTYLWKNVAVSDFSAGEGFLVLFIKVDVDDSDKLTGISYKWQKKTADGSYTLATDEEIKLIVKEGDNDIGGYVGLKYKGDESKGSIGFQIPRKSEGSLVVSTGFADGSVNVRGSELTEAMVKVGVLFTDLTTNPGISYDDKLGMRFFF